MTTLGGTYTSGVVIGTSTYTSPLTVASTGYVGNSAGYGITAGYAGVTLVNDGAITGTGGIGFSGGLVSNSATGTITGTDNEGIYSRGYATVLNAGTITSDKLFGVYLNAGGSLSNSSSGQIYGYESGVVNAANGTVINAGIITGGKEIGVVLQGGYASNASTGIIQGAVQGLYTAGDATVINDGTISGGQYGVYSYNNASVVNTGSIGSSSGIGVYFHDGGTLVESGQVSGSTTAVYFGRYGTDTYGALLVVDSSAVFVGSVTSQAGLKNTIELASGSTAGTLDMGDSFANFTTIKFDAGAVWTLEGITAELAASETITGFAGGDTIDLTDFTATSESYAGGVLTLTNGVGATETITFSGEPAGLTSANFTLATGGSISGTDITLCFYPGTRLATPDGDVAVEDLAVGDAVLTANGAMPVRWIGRSEVATRFADKLRSLPVRIKAGALGAGLPLRDLLVSPDHAMFLDDVLVHASAMVDGVNILREYDVPEIFSYYHVELASHELLLAEGAWTESFVDNVDRMHFHNWDEREAPALPIMEMEYPRVKSARQLPAVLRARLAA